MKKSISVCFLVIFIDNALAQYAYIGPSTSPQLSKQQLVNYLLSNFNKAPLSERIDVLTAAVQQLPPKRNRRVYLADALKNSALQSLMVAARVCGDGTALGTEYTTPLQGYTLPSYGARNLAEPKYASLPRQNAVAQNELSNYASRNFITGNPNELSNLAALARNLAPSELSSYASVPRGLIGCDELSFAPTPRQNLGLPGLAPNEAPLVANRELLSALLPRDLLSSLVGDNPRALRF